MMKEKEILEKYPDINIYNLAAFLRKNKLDHKFSFGGDLIVDEAHVIKFIEHSNPKKLQVAEENAKIAEENARIAEEEARKRKAMAQMLITSGFNFDGYKITKYSG